MVRASRIFVIGVIASLLFPGSTAAAGRVDRNLLVIYPFDEQSGTVIHDRSGNDPPLDLHIEQPSAITWGDGDLTIKSAATIRSAQPATRLLQAVSRTGEATIEAWVQTADLNQNGPARIVTLSKDTGERNLTLGQEKNTFEVRFRTSGTTGNGSPSLTSRENAVTTDLLHVAYTRNRAGRARLYLNGQLAAEETILGNLSNWNPAYFLAIGNELSNDRPWLGTFHLVAIYNRALSSAEIERNFAAGADAKATPAVASLSDRSPGAVHFETQIAPLLARNCLECHDSATKEGELDLSRKMFALEGGENGKVIHAGKADDSSLWKLIESNAMPKDRDPLTAEQKNLIRQWIDDGAVWSVDFIDPAVYAHASTSELSQMRRLTVAEYIESVRSAVGVDVGKEARELLPPDLRTDGFSNTGYNLNVDLKHVEAFAQLAEIIVSRIDVPKFTAEFAKSRSLSTDDTMRQFVADMGKWILRGPLDDREVTVYSGIATTVASAGGDFDEAARFVIEAMLQSPRFIYHLENQQGDGAARPVDEFELASRLSYILWGAPPDRELIRAAEAGELFDPNLITQQIDRMLDDPRAIDQSARFIDEWMHLSRLENLRPHAKRFPGWNEQLAADMRDETLAFFKFVVWEQKRPLSELFNAQVTFASPRLAAHYGLGPPADESADERGLMRYDLENVPARGGLLTHGSVLTVGGDEASMVSRGLFVFHDVLRGIVKSPPPCVDTTPVPAKPGLTQRGVAEARIANANCAGCHAKFEPLAFGLEKFDGIGAFHETDEYANPLRDDGEIRFPGEAEAVAYKSSAELMDRLAGSERVRESITWKLTQFALGRPLDAADVHALDAIHKSAQEGGGTYESLIKAIIQSDLVQTKMTETTP